MPVVNCPIDIPEGWEFVAFRPPNAGERFCVGDGKTGIADHNYIASKVVIRRARPAIEVGDWVRVDCEGRHLHGKVVRVVAIDGGSAAVTSGFYAGSYAISRLIKQTRTIEPYTMGDLIAAINDRRESLEPRFTDDIHGKLECERQSRLIVFQGEKVIEEIYHAGIGGPFSEKQQFISYIEAAHVVTWSGGEAFGTETWRDAE